LKVIMRIILGVLVLAVVVITISQVLFLPPVSTEKAYASFASLAVSTPSPSPTATPTPSFLEQFNQNWINPALNLIVVILIIVLVLILAVRVITLTRSSNLVIETFKNSTGNADLDKVLLGLTQRMREKLVNEIEVVREVTKIYKQVSPNPGQSPSRAPIPAEDVDQRLTNLLKSLQDVATGQFKTAVQLISLVFPPRGTKVITVLLLGEANVQSGVSLEITDLKDRLEPKIYTIWERSNAPDVFSNNQSTATHAISSSSQPPPGHTKLEHNDSLAQRLLAAVVHNESPKKDKSKEDKSEGNKPDLQALQGYYIKLQKPVARWLAIELARRSWAEGHTQRNRSFYQAKLCNFIGALYLASASDRKSFSDYPFFYELAVQDFKNAIKEAKTWYQPYENLGDTYSIWGQYVQDQNSIDRQQQALLYYDQALQYLKAPIRHLSNETETERKIIERRVRVAKAHTQLHIGILTSNDELKRQARGEIDSAKQQWVDFSETDSRILYDLACCHALLGERSIARRLLIYSLARDINRFKEASNEPDLKSIIDGLENCYRILEQKLKLDPALKEKGSNFKDAIDKVLNKAGWLQ
jgi:hypothetical protein